MILSRISFHRIVRASTLLVCTSFCIQLLSAKPIPANLGYGLDKLVESNLALKNSEKGTTDALYNGFATQEAASYDAAAIKAEDGRYKVDITLTGRASFDQMRDHLQATFSSLEITSVDATYRGVGIIEAWVSVEEAAALAQTKGVQAVFLALKPALQGMQARSPEGATKESKEPAAPPSTSLGMVGSKFDQGVTQHRVDKVNQFYNPSAPVNINGTGITVGVLSDSFNTRGTGSSATSAMASFDLPGDPSNPVNTQPVVVLEDYPARTDEGRGMSEIVYKMAPKAKVGFATAFTGEVGFGNNIRALSGRFPSVPNTRADFKADVICDDVGYGGEPVFADGGVIANGVDDVAAMGVAYFSSASNNFGVSVYNSDLRWVANGTGVTAATNSALVGTNIDLTGVPTDLYQGGFHNFNPNGQDVACLWTVSNGGVATEMQWDDPYDSTVNLNEPPIFTGSGTLVTSANPPPVDFTGLSFTPRNYVILVTAVPGSPVDVVVSVIRESDGRTLFQQDTGTDETVNFYPPAAGNYTVRVATFPGSSGGGFDIKIYTGNNSPVMTTDINMLAFRADNGAYVPASSLTSNNFANNRPVELGSATGVAGQLQFVIARSNVPTGPRGPTRIRLGSDANNNSGNAPAEYFDYNSTVTGGHNTAAGCNGVAAYDVFRPNLPQDFTSAGPALIYFNRNGQLLPNGPEVRLQPRLAAANNASTTWLTNDSPNDVDTGGGQFGGTSAASPHAAAIAALVLQAHGGTGSVTPAQMTSILQRSTFPHDLDPYLATGVARASNGGKVTVSIRSDNTATAARGRNDPNSHAIAYVGPSAISTFKFNPNGLASEGGAVTSGQNGVDASNNYFSNVTPGMYFATATATGAFAFTRGASVGIATADVTAALSNQAPPPAAVTANQGQTLTLSFASGSFTGGDIMRFTIGRGLIRGPNVVTAGGASAAATLYNSDSYGGGVLIPEGTVIPDGMHFSGTLEDGATFDGIMRNRLGFGFSNLDGFGFINAEQAITTPIQ